MIMGRISIIFIFNLYSTGLFVRPRVPNVFGLNVRLKGLHFAIDNE